MGAREVLHERSWAAEAVAEKIDVLLERATDAVLGAPRPGSEAWQQAWAARDTAAGRAASAHRAQAKTSIAVAAGVDPSRELERARRAGILAGETATESPKKPNRCPRRGTTTASSRCGEPVPDQHRSRCRGGQ